VLLAIKPDIWSRFLNAKTQIATCIRTLRKRKGLSQEALAQRIGIDAKSLSRLEHGAHFPSIETLEKMAEALDVQLKDFFDFSGKPSVEEMRSKVINAAQEANYSLLEKMVGIISAQ
jgi:transcriptional regulator with XRE-family HTH domain